MPSQGKPNAQVWEVARAFGRAARVTILVLGGSHAQLADAFRYLETAGGEGSPGPAAP
mgnify:CR=1 FL=1